MASPILASVTPLLAVCALACPVGMGAMMWFMSRGSRSNDAPPARPPSTLDDLRHEHERLGTQIESLEGAHGDGEHAEPREPSGPVGRVSGSVPDARDTLSG